MRAMTSTFDALRRLAETPLGFGGAPLGNLFSAMADEVAVALVRHAYAMGARYFDTAPHYGNGRSERRLGAGLGQVPRSSYLLSTKVGRILDAAADAPRDQHGYVDTRAVRAALRLHRRRLSPLARRQSDAAWRYERRYRLRP